MQLLKPMKKVLFSYILSLLLRCVQVRFTLLNRLIILFTIRLINFNRGVYRNSTDLKIKS